MPKSATFKLKTIHVDKLTYKRPIGGSSHAVHYYVDPNNHQAFYVKKAEDSHTGPTQEEQESYELESTLSAIYRMDIGRSASLSSLLVDRTNRVIGVASMAHPNFIPCAKFDSKGLSWEKIKNLDGWYKIFASSWYYQDDDFHANNWGLAQENERTEPYLARIDYDGGHCEVIQRISRSFAQLSRQRGYSKSTYRDFIELPALEDARFFYWPTKTGYINTTFNVLGRWKDNTYDPAKEKLFKQLKTNPAFIQEKKEFLLTLFLIPINDKQTLCEANITDNDLAKKISKNIAQQINTVRWAALAEESSRNYLHEIVKEYKAAKHTSPNTITETQLYQHIKKTYERLALLPIEKNPYQQQAENLSPDTLEQTSFFIEIAQFFKSMDDLAKPENLISYPSWEACKTQCDQACQAACDPLGDALNGTYGSPLTDKEKRSTMQAAYTQLLEHALYHSKKASQQKRPYYHIQDALDTIQQLENQTFLPDLKNVTPYISFATPPDSKRENTPSSHKRLNNDSFKTRYGTELKYPRNATTLFNNHPADLPANNFSPLKKQKNTAAIQPSLYPPHFEFAANDLQQFIKRSLPRKEKLVTGALNTLKQDLLNPQVNRKAVTKRFVTACKKSITGNNSTLDENTKIALKLVAIVAAIALSTLVAAFILTALITKTWMTTGLISWLMEASSTAAPIAQASIGIGLVSGAWAGYTLFKEPPVVKSPVDCKIEAVANAALHGSQLV